MKILHVIGSFDKKNGGVYSAITSITDMERSLGYTSDILSIKSDDQQYDSSFFNGQVNLFNRSFPYIFSPSKEAERWIELNVENYDLIVLHEVWAILAVRVASIAKKHEVKYIIWPHGSLDPFDLKKKSFLKKILGNIIIKGVTTNATAICCTSSIERDVLETYNDRKNVNISVLPLPIGFNAEGSRQRFRNKHNIPADTFVFLFLSRVDYKKGLDLFLHAYKRFVHTNNGLDVKLIIAGKGNRAYETYINRLIDEMQLSAYTYSAGFLSGTEKADAFAGSDCFILPSMNENYGISVIEALQSNLPVLISDNVYIWKDIVPVGGWVCKHNVDSISNSLNVIHHEFISKQIRMKDPAKVGESFKKDRLISLYSDFYDLVINKQEVIFS
ncbi:glycosyltransferase [Arcticibacter tournemirensis]|nr:glycosyltransferase [Arcticibacter tournemirensis]